MFQTKINDHLSLRRLTIQDAQPLFGLVQRNISILQDYMPWATPNMTVEDEANWIQNMLKKSIDGTVYAFVLLFDDQVIGALDLHHIDPINQHAEIGYWLDQSHQGQGLMTKAVQKLEEIAFYELDLQRIEIQAVTQNTASRGIPERLNYHLDGVLRQYLNYNDQFWDVVVYSHLKTD
ncbi:GNAT family N-acetyltransferase [Agrilactobacillus fermenti]|uniref:GNAT family N-acetyltransferase n=1 Tax=Agrilactobacillus fermenti TaxID=2586909 RepID=UPI001E5464EE|nr:GNAT family protein [Agrilactobacillus fermenti]MCD2255508.1 GNAT family N-acetyltransferase [Agrilactobacillus fermenti]